MMPLILLASISSSSLADGTCAGDLVQPFPLVARAFLLLTTLRQQLLQHAANVSAHLSVAGSLRLAVFTVAHRSSPLATAAVFAPLLSIVIANIPENVA